jgi:hypothetical protein
VFDHLVPRLYSALDPGVAVKAVPVVEDVGNYGTRIRETMMDEHSRYTMSISPTHLHRTNNPELGA